MTSLLRAPPPTLWKLLTVLTSGRCLAGTPRANPAPPLPSELICANSGACGGNAFKVRHLRLQRTACLGLPSLSTTLLVSLTWWPSAFVPTLVGLTPDQRRRVSEAKNPGPRRRAGQPRNLRVDGDLESQPLQSASLLFLGTSAWTSFLGWVSLFLSVDLLGLFASCPVLAAMVLRAYGNYCSGGTKHTFRLTLVGAQRELPLLKGSLAPAWELLSRWEAVVRAPDPAA